MEFNPVQFLDQINNPKMIALSVKGFFYPREIAMIRGNVFPISDGNKIKIEKPYEIFDTPYILFVPATSIHEASQIRIKIPEIKGRESQYCIVKYKDKKLIIDESIEFFVSRIDWKLV